MANVAWKVPDTLALIFLCASVICDRSFCFFFFSFFSLFLLDRLNVKKMFIRSCFGFLIASIDYSSSRLCVLFVVLKCFVVGIVGFEYMSTRGKRFGSP